MIISKENQQLALSILEEANVPQEYISKTKDGVLVKTFDPLTILTIISVIIEIIKFIYPHFQNLNKLPFWKKALIRLKLSSKFGLKKAREVESVIYKKVSAISKEQADSLINLIV